MNSAALFKELSTFPSTSRLLDILRSLSTQVRTPKVIYRYHEALLFTKAYPRSRGLHEFATSELNLFARYVKQLKPADHSALDQSGIVGTRAYYSYDYPNARWLASVLGADVEIDWDEYETKADDPLSALLPLLLSTQESDALDNSDLSTCDSLNLLQGKKTALQWLIEQLDQRYSAAIRDQLYDPLALPLAMRLNRKASRTTVDAGKPQQLSLWDPQAARAPFDFMKEVKRPLRLPPPVPVKRGRELLYLVHQTLLCRLRELYPMTYGNPAEVYDVKFERGIRVIFWMMLPARRLPLEVGWDFLMLKNNVPIAYGGGGLIHDRLEHAINVFDTFRGGEAAWLFAQISRIAYSLNPAPWIVVRKFQLGGDGNTEGIKSGSYWFYDKLGFRSTDSTCRKLADSERHKINRDKSHRTPSSILKTFAAHDVVLSLTGETPARYREYPLGKIGLLAAKLGATSLASLIKTLRKQGRFTPREYESALVLARLKTSKQEAAYARSLRANLRLFSILEQLVAK